jgi:hypothetical protein
VGAQLLIHSIGFKAKDRCLIDAKWARDAFARARRAIQGIDAAGLAKINAAQDTPYADVKGCKRRLLGDLKEVEMAVFRHHRQAGVQIGGGGTILLLAGGMSWAIRQASCSIASHGL